MHKSTGEASGPTARVPSSGLPPLQPALPLGAHTSYLREAVQPSRGGRGARMGPRWPRALTLALCALAQLCSGYAKVRGRCTTAAPCQAQPAGRRRRRPVPPAPAPPAPPASPCAHAPRPAALPAAAQTVEVATCVELLAAMNDTSVDRVLLEPVPGGWSCSEEQFPRFGVRVRHRNLTMQGKGPGLVYFNVSWEGGRGLACRLLWVGSGRPSARPSAGRHVRRQLPPERPARRTRHPGRARLPTPHCRHACRAGARRTRSLTCPCASPLPLSFPSHPSLAARSQPAGQSHHVPGGHRPGGHRVPPQPVGRQLPHPRLPLRLLLRPRPRGCVCSWQGAPAWLAGCSHACFSGPDPAGVRG